MNPIAFHGGAIYRGQTAPDADHLLVLDGVVAPWDGIIPEGAETIDLAGGFLGPAFGDGHAHPIFAGREFAGPIIRDETSLEGILARVSEWAAAHPEAEWIVGGSYDATIIPGGVFDSRWLDDAVGDRPVVLHAWDYHSVWCNSAALRLAGIDDSSDDPTDGIIPRHDNGMPVGTLFESGAVDLVLSRIPQPSIDDGVEALRQASSVFASHGITWVQDAWVEPDDIDVWVEAAKRGVLGISADLALRADPSRWADQQHELADLRSRVSQVSELTCNTVKFFVDGIIENRTAHLLEPYADACTRGLPVWSDARLQEALVDVDNLDFDVHIHAIGDAGVRSALDAIEHLHRNGRERDRRPTIAHAQLIDEADLKRFAQLGVIVCFQPLWSTADDVMNELTLPRLGAGRELQYRIASMLESSARISFGSDWPVTTPDALAGIRTAITRQTPAGTPSGGWHPQERISIEDALDAATSGVAYQARAEHIRGRLTPGAQADLVWLSADPRKVPPEALGNIEVLGTWRAGQRTF